MQIYKKDESRKIRIETLTRTSYSLIRTIYKKDESRKIRIETQINVNPTIIVNVTIRKMNPGK